MGFISVDTVKTTWSCVWMWFARSDQKACSTEFTPVFSAIQLRLDPVLVPGVNGAFCVWDWLTESQQDNPSRTIPDTIPLETSIWSPCTSLRVWGHVLWLFSTPLSAPKKTAQMKIAVSRNFTFHRVKLVCVFVCFFSWKAFCAHAVTDLRHCF